MSNSRRRAPIAGMTNARSDKPFKKAEHSRERAAVKIALTHDRELPSSKLFGDEWHSEKDGKRYDPEDPKIRRK